jgi:hypothetical protein
MRSIFKSGLVAVALLACVALAGAQGGGGGQGRRGGGQRGGGGLLATAMRADVQKDLAVTDDQKTKLTALQEKERAAAQAARQNGGGGGGGNGGGGGTFDAAAFQKRAEEQRAQQKKDLSEVLNDGQMKRLDEIVIQLAGNGAIASPDVQKALGLSDDQVAKIKDLQAKLREANSGLRAKVTSGEMTREESRAASTKNTATMNDELAKVLTSDQAAKLKSMGGKPFTADAPGGGR